MARYVVQCHISYQSIGHDEFIGLLELCNPITKSLRLPSDDKLSSFILSTFLNGQTAMKSILKKIPLKISLTCDGWTSPGNHSVLGVTAHWIDKFELKIYDLSAEKLIDRPHTGVNLQTSHIAKVLQTFGISQSIFCITANNACNNTTMAAKLNKLIGFDHEN